MLLNNTQKDLAALCKESGKTQTQAAADIGITQAGLAQAARRRIISESYQKAVESLGYDMEIVYIKRQ